MRNRKFTFLLCMALTVAVAMFGVTDGKAAISGWNVSLDNNANVFTYTFTTAGGDKVSFVEMLLPLEINPGGPGPTADWPKENIRVEDEVGNPIPYEWIDGPTGDGSTGFGIGLPDKNLIKVKSNNAKSFPADAFTVKIVVNGQNPDSDEMLAAEDTVMLVKAGNGQVWESDVIGGPGYVPIPPPPPPIGIDSEFLSVEGHPGYAMELRKDLYGVFTEICLDNAVTREPVIDQVPLTVPPTECCTEGGNEFVCNPNPGDPNEEVKLNLGNLGTTVVMCTGGTPTAVGGLDDPEGCGYAKFYSLETGAKSGEGTCGWKFFYGRYAYICF